MAVSGWSLVMRSCSRQCCRLLDLDEAALLSQRLHTCRTSTPHMFSTSSNGPTESESQAADLPSASEEERQATATEAAPSKEGIRIDRFFLDKKFLEPPSTKFPIPGKKKGKRPNRAQRGSYRSPGMREALHEGSQEVPPGVPLYDLQTTFPYFYEPRNPAMELMESVKEEDPDQYQQFLDSLGGEEEEPPYPGARQILHWETNLVLMTGDFNHPMNKKVKCWVYLRDLQAETGLSDDAIRHIALIAGPRYNPKTGELMLTCDKYPSSVENQEHIMLLLNRLVDEGEKAYPSSSPST